MTKPRPTRATRSEPLRGLNILRLSFGMDRLNRRLSLDETRAHYVEHRGDVWDAFESRTADRPQEAAARCIAQHDADLLRRSKASFYLRQREDERDRAEAERHRRIA